MPQDQLQFQTDQHEQWLKQIEINIEHKTSIGELKKQMHQRDLLVTGIGILLILGVFWCGAVQHTLYMDMQKRTQELSGKIDFLVNDEIQTQVARDSIQNYLRKRDSTIEMGLIDQNTQLEIRIRKLEEKIYHIKH